MGVRGVLAAALATTAAVVTLGSLLLMSRPDPTPEAPAPPNASAPSPAESPLMPVPAPTSGAEGVSSARIGEVPQDLRMRALTLPVPGVSPDALTPQFYDARGERGHEAIDIMAPQGAPVVAVEDGVIAKLFLSNAGGLTIYQFDPSGTYAYYYAHLDRYAPTLAEGLAVKRGQVIAYVGMTGNAPVPHLHFAIFRLGPEKHWWQGEPLDPYPVLSGR